ncbi:DUF4271 domain-containing protein [Yeosuana sp. MJ-SS3]|uniref:DUF4271 domain-containing protein n=1 Tax=Gilvirhabdus luticola TaxID=3079858 RepID=A0ABU3U3H5_9FLAO|nr:DUF4271 domain-containing protein [Yeosuana sp. MJ-SS3]MDU8884953.1 DUF4271 domain-containing protein [Yeosuana sp. MJ-SS3]
MLRDIASNEIFTVLIILGLFFIASAKLLSPKRFDEFVLVLGNSKYLKIYSREQKFLDMFDALLFVNLIISITVFIFLVYQNLVENINPSTGLLLKLIFGLGIFILIKVLIERLVGSLFDMDSIIDQYLFQKISYKNFIGIILIPINALLIYSFNANKIVVFIVIGILFCISIMGLITSIKSYQSLIKNNLFYFILYLCALEIAPYLVLYKVISAN